MQLMISSNPKQLLKPEKTRSLAGKSCVYTAALAVILTCVLFATPSKAFTYRDGEGEGEPCPAPRPCNKTVNHVSDQDNSYHNTLQALHGTKDKTVNIFVTAPETLTTPAQYETTTPPDYVPVTGGYQYNGAGVGYTPPPPPPPR